MNIPDLKRIFQVYKAPFRYDRDGQIIFDKNNHHVADIRGWGYLQYFPDGAEIQDNAGLLITQLLNEKAKEL